MDIVRINLGRRCIISKIRVIFLCGVNLLMGICILCLIVEKVEFMLFKVE